MSPSKSSGFTMIETMVAVGILGVLLLSSVMLMVRVNNSIGTNRRIITGTYLLQECQELVRNLRDSAWKQNLEWNCGFNRNPANDAQYRIESSWPSSPQYDASSCLSNAVDHHFPPSSSFVKLWRPPSNLFPNASTFVDDYLVSGFTNGDTYYRWVEFPAAGNGALSIAVDCHVGWEDRDNEQKTMTLSQILTDWFKH